MAVTKRWLGVLFALTLTTWILISSQTPSKVFRSYATVPTTTKSFSTATRQANITVPEAKRGESVIVEKTTQTAIAQDLFLTFVDPETYQGPIIDGWPPSKSRQMDFYIRPNENTVINDISCLNIPDSVRTAIFIQSAPEMMDRRKACRDTWMSRASDDIKILFIFGRSDPDPELTDEQQQHCDLIQMDFGDSYSNVTFDTVMSLKFASSLGRRIETIIIGDDDSYLNLIALRAYLAKRKPEFEIIGRKISDASAAVHFPEAEQFAINQVLPYHTWTYNVAYLYNGTNYPSFVSGGAYILGRAAISCLYEASLSLPYFHINDVFLTGFARSLCKMPLVNAQSFFSGKIDASWDPAQILYHGVKPKAMTEVHELFLKNT